MRKIKFFLSAVCLLVFSCLVYAGDETITITTYYPTPQGTFKNLDVKGNLTVSGTVGIGTTSPGFQLDVRGNTAINGASLYIRSNPVVAWDFLKLSTDGSIGRLDIKQVDFCIGVNNITDADETFTDVFSITQPNGNVGIGTTNPLSKLDVEGDTAVFGNPSGNVRILKTAGTLSSDDLGIWNAVGGGGQVFNIADWNTGTKGLSINTTSGNVGIGTTNPQTLLHIYKSQNAITDMLLENPNTGNAAQALFHAKCGSTELYVGAKSPNFQHAYGPGWVEGDGWIGTYSNHPLVLMSGNMERVRISANGNVGIGMVSADGRTKTEPSATFEVKGTMKVLGAWETKNYDTVYQAPSDGFINAWVSAPKESDRGYIIARTDSSNPPTTIRAIASVDGVVSFGNSISVPVRKGDYWKVYKAASGMNVEVYWIPLGTE